MIRDKFGVMKTSSPSVTGLTAGGTDLCGVLSTDCGSSALQTRFGSLISPTGYSQYVLFTEIHHETSEPMILLLNDQSQAILPKPTGNFICLSKKMRVRRQVTTTRSGLFRMPRHRTIDVYIWIIPCTVRRFHLDNSTSLHFLPISQSLI
jgi:hypothetical protein